MFFDTYYLRPSANTPDFSDDPIMAGLTQGQYDNWLPRKVDLLSIIDIAHVGYDDRCEVTYHTGYSFIVREPWERMSEIHRQVQMTIEDYEAMMAPDEIPIEAPGFGLGLPDDIDLDHFRFE